MKIFVYFTSVLMFAQFSQANEEVATVHSHNAPFVRQIRSLNPSVEADCQTAQNIIPNFKALRILFADGYRQMSFPLGPPVKYRCPCTSYQMHNSHGGVGNNFGTEWQNGTHQIGGPENRFISGIPPIWGKQSGDPNGYPLESPAMEVVPLNLNVGTSICHQLETMQKLTEAFELPAADAPAVTRGSDTSTEP